MDAHRWVLPTLAVGGMVGASARYTLAQHFPATPGHLPWTTLTINVTGSLLIGILMVFVVEVGGAHPLLRPFLGVGVLGGYTTFSTYTVETLTLIQTGHPGTALTYLIGTAAAALGGAAAGVSIARTAHTLKRHLASTRGGTR